MARVLSRYSERDATEKKAKKLHLFDSFIGLPDAVSEVDKKSPHVKSGTWGPGTCFVLNKEEIVELCSVSLPRERIVVYEGWFKDTLPLIPENLGFSLIHIDSDLYQSAAEVLDYCFGNNLIKEGTAIFFDEWDANRASPEWGERRAWAEVVERYSVDYSDCGEYGWASRKFIVHAYLN